MNILFHDTSGISYTKETPLTEPLGGTESAVCFLTTSLEKIGHTVRIANVKPNADYTFKGEIPYYIVVISRPTECLHLKKLKLPSRIIYWTGESYDQPVHQALKDPEVVDAIDIITVPSNWVKSRLSLHCPLTKDKIVPIRYGCGSSFQDVSFSSKDLTLVYCSTPYRGLDVLLDSFPMVQKEIPEAKLKIFSGMNLYRRDQQDSKFQELYNKAKSLKNVTYSSAINQTQLAQELVKSSILAYPNTYEETFCTVLANCMATGCYPIITNIGALPEVALGYGRFVNLRKEVSREDLVLRFTQACIYILRRIKEQDPSFINEVQEMIVAARTMYSWDTIAKEWEYLFKAIK